MRETSLNLRLTISSVGLDRGRSAAEVRSRRCCREGAYGEGSRTAGRQALPMNLGIVLQEKGDLKAARENYERALQIAPDLADVIYNLASVLEQQGQEGTSRAAIWPAKLLARNPEWEDAWFRLGYLRLQRDDHRRGSRSLPELYPKEDSVAGSAVEPRPGVLEAGRA